MRRASQISATQPEPSHPRQEWRGILHDATLIVVSTGFAAGHVPLFDTMGDPIPLARDASGQVKVNGLGQCITESHGPLRNLLGSGLGYGQSLHSPLLDAERGFPRDDEKGRRVARADGVDLYVGTYGRITLKGLLDTREENSDPEAEEEEEEEALSPSLSSSSSPGQWKPREAVELSPRKARAITNPHPYAGVSHPIPLARPRQHCI